MLSETEQNNRRMAELKQVGKDPHKIISAVPDPMPDALQPRQNVEDLIAELRESEYRYRALFDLGPVAVYSIDTSGIIQHFNRRAAQLWGRKPALGDTDERFCGSYKLFRPDGSLMSHEECPMALVVSGKLPAVHDTEVVIERPDGSRVTVIVNIRPLKNERGAVSGAINCFYDITERKQTEETHRALTQQLSEELAGTQLLQATSTLLIQIGDIQTLYDQILDAATAIMRSHFGSMQMFYPERGERGELRLLTFRGFNPQAAQSWEWVKAATPTTCGVALSTRRQCIVPDIEQCDFMKGTDTLEAYRQTGIRSVQSTPLLSRDGTFVGMISTHWREPHQPPERNLRLLDILARQAADLIERRCAEQKLRESEQETKRQRDYAQAILRTSPVPLLVLEKDLRVQSANEAFYQTFRVGPAVTEGSPVYDLGNGQWNIPKLRQLLQDILPNHSAFKHFEATHDFETIGRRTMLLNARRMQNDAGAPERIVLVIEDITERKRAEAALALAQAQLADRAANLEDLVSERTARLQDTIAELEHFSYTITHDMRAPLRAMQGFGGMLLQDPGVSLSPASADCVERIMDAACRMDALIRDSLQYAKVVREHPPLTPVEPGPVLHGILRSYPSLQAPNVEIQVAEPLPSVIAAETGLTQCFSNLLINAVKFVRPGITPKIRIWAEVRQQSSPGTVRFWFEDNGVGIPPEYHDRIFEMFQQLDKSCEGTGIGLALVRKTAERMKGKVGVESELGVGSRFWLELTSAVHA